MRVSKHVYMLFFFVQIVWELTKVNNMESMNDETPKCIVVIYV